MSHDVAANYRYGARMDIDDPEVDLTRDRLFAHMFLAVEAVRQAPPEAEYAVLSPYWYVGSERSWPQRSRARGAVLALITVLRRLEEWLACREWRRCWNTKRKGKRT